MTTPRLGSGLARTTSTSEDQQQRDELGQPRGRQPRVLALEVGELRLDHADRQPADDRRDQRGELAEDGGGQRRDDEERVADRRRRDDRRDEDARDAGDRRS